MMRGKVRAALRMVSDLGSAGVLSLEKEIDGKPVRDILREKHPAAQAACSAALLSLVDNTVETHPVLFERIDGDLIRSTALKVQGSAGPSGMDAAGWRLCAQHSREPPGTTAMPCQPLPDASVPLSLTLQALQPSSAVG